MTDSSHSAVVMFLNTQKFLVSGTTKLQASFGIFNFTDITITGEPENPISLNVVGDFTSQGSYSNINISFSLRKCTSGEYFSNNNTCIVCPSGKYNLIAGSECKPCPTGAICYGGNKILAASGY